MGRSIAIFSFPRHSRSQSKRSGSLIRSEWFPILLSELKFLLKPTTLGVLSLQAVLRLKLRRIHNSWVIPWFYKDDTLVNDPGTLICNASNGGGEGMTTRADRDRCRRSILANTVYCKLPLKSAKWNNVQLHKVNVLAFLDIVEKQRIRMSRGRKDYASRLRYWGRYFKCAACYLPTGLFPAIGRLPRGNAIGPANLRQHCGG